MVDQIYVDILGYLCIIPLIASYIMHSEKKIRIVNIIACIFYIVYGALLPSPSVLFVNIALTFIHIFKLVQEHYTEKYGADYKNILHSSSHANIINRFKSKATSIGRVDSNPTMKNEFQVIGVLFIISVVATFLLGMPYEEIAGTFASLIFLYAFMLSGERRIRQVALCGNIAYIIYSILIFAVPMIFSNIIVATIHIVKINSLFAAEKKEQSADNAITDSNDSENT